jgi:hypothetical protein
MARREANHLFELSGDSISQESAISAGAKGNER